MLNFFIFRRFKRLISGENISKDRLDLADEKIVTYLLEAHLVLLTDLSKFVDCLDRIILQKLESLVLQFVVKSTFKLS